MEHFYDLNLKFSALLFKTTFYGPYFKVVNSYVLAQNKNVHSSIFFMRE